MNSPLDSESLKRIADSLEALAAAQTHELWADHLKALVASKNENWMESFKREHPCPRCSKG
jgi:hypothetical protein